MSAPIDIGPAVMHRLRDDLVVVRFKPSSIADPATFHVSVEARRKHFGAVRHAVVLVAPDDADFDPALLRGDQYRDTGSEAFTKALAIVSQSQSLTRVLELYYALHPAPFSVRFFTEEQEAQRWAEEQASAGKASASLIAHAALVHLAVAIVVQPIAR